MVIGYGHDEILNSLYREAKTRGIAVVNDLHCGCVYEKYSFVDCDLVFTFSEAIASTYLEKANIDVKSVGPFVNKQQLLALDREQIDHVQCVTLVNPVPENGLAIFIKLQEVFSSRHPEIQFLVVGSNGTFPDVLSCLHCKDGTPYVSGASGNIKSIEHLDDPRMMYRTSQVIVMPSLKYEVWGLSATRAVVNGIPVLASKKGGLQDAVGEGGILLDVPSCTQNDFCCVPDDDEITPWVEALERCINANWTEACLKTSERFDIERNTDRLMEYLEPLLKQAQNRDRSLQHSTIFCNKALQKRQKQAKSKQRYPNLSPKTSTIKRIGSKLSGFISRVLIHRAAKH